MPENDVYKSYCGSREFSDINITSLYPRELGEEVGIGSLDLWRRCLGNLAVGSRQVV
jgi:hypothetical protein